MSGSRAELNVYINVVRPMIRGQLTQCGVSGGTPSSVTGSDRDCVVHALWEAADVQRQGRRASWKGLQYTDLLFSITHYN